MLPIVLHPLHPLRASENTTEGNGPRDYENPKGDERKINLLERELGINLDFKLGRNMPLSPLQISPLPKANTCTKRKY